MSVELHLATMDQITDEIHRRTLGLYVLVLIDERTMSLDIYGSEQDGSIEGLLSAGLDPLKNGKPYTSLKTDVEPGEPL